MKRHILSKKMGVLAIAVMTLVGTSAAGASAAGSGVAPASPAAKVQPHAVPLGGKIHAATKPGERQVFLNDVLQPAGTTVAAMLARGSKNHPVDVAEVTADSSAPSLASGYRSALVTRTANLYYGFSLLYTTMRQTWGFHDGFVYYWPNGYVTCRATGPTYNSSCQNPPYQEYGMYFTQGHTYWDANLCAAWVNYIYSSFCLSNDHVHRWYTFNSNGTWYRFA